MGSGGDEENVKVVPNKQVLAKHLVPAIPKETDFYLRNGSIGLKLEEGSNSLLLKNLYLSCDPYLRRIKAQGVEEDRPPFFTLDSVEQLKTKFEFNEAFNYKDEPDFNTALKRYFPKGIDIYFDNVGGKMLDAVLLNMRLHSRIAVAGMISKYNLEQPEGITNLMRIVFNQIRIQGFMVFDYYNLYPRFLDTVLPFIKEGKIVYDKDITQGLETEPTSLAALFTGRNAGKSVILVSRD